MTITNGNFDNYIAPLWKDAFGLLPKPELLADLRMFADSADDGFNALADAFVGAAWRWKELKTPDAVAAWIIRNTKATLNREAAEQVVARLGWTPAILKERRYCE